MEIIVNYKEGLNTKHALLVSTREFSMASDCLLSKQEIEALMRSCDNDIYLACNQMMFDEDLNALRKHLEWAKAQNFKGIYFADMAVYMLAEELNIKELLIYAPGMTLVNHEDVSIYLGLGIQGVELANELTLAEKSQIMRAHPNQVGVVIGGYLNTSVSKRMFLTNYFNQIEKEVDVKENTNLTLIEDTREGKMPIYEDQHGTYIYSEYILDSFEFIQELVASDVGLMRVDSIFMDVDIVNDLLAGYDAVLAGKNAKTVRDEFINKYPALPFEIGFYDTETNLVKE